MLLHNKVTPCLTNLNPDADIFQCTSPTSTCSTRPASSWSDQTVSDFSVLNISGGSLSVNHIDMPGGIVHMAVLYPNNLTPTTTTTTDLSSDQSPVNGNHVDVELPSSVAVTSSTSSHSDSDEASTLDSFLPSDQLRAILKTQLEYYFSRENLASDTYLLSQMDADQFVQIATVASFNQVKRLTHNLDLITDVLRESPNVQVDEKGEKVRPIHKRCIIILREIPESTPVKDVEGLFSGASCPKFVSCQFAHNDSWYVTFESEEDAQKAYCYLREEVRTFHDMPIMARIKAKPLFGSSSNVGAKEVFKVPYENGVYTSPKFTYTSPVPSIQYITPQSVPFFTHQTGISPMWSSSMTYFDPGMAFAANGYIPTAAFTPACLSVGSPVVHPHSRYSCNRRLDHGDDCNFTHGRRTISNGRNSGTGKLLDEETAAGNGKRSVRGGAPRIENCRGITGGMNRLNSPRKVDGRGIGGARGTARSSHSSDVTTGANGNDDRHLEHTTEHVGSSLSASATRDQGSSSGRHAASYRSRKKNRGLNETAKATGSNSEPPPPAFELEEKYFPPLPGSTQQTTVRTDHLESKISDVVRGTNQRCWISGRDTPVHQKTNTSAVVQTTAAPTASKSCSVELSNVSNTNTKTAAVVVVSTVGQTSARPSYAQMALRGKDRQPEENKSETDTEDVVPSVLHEKQTHIVHMSNKSKSVLLETVTMEAAQAKENRSNKSVCHSSKNILDHCGTVVIQK